MSHRSILGLALLVVTGVLANYFRWTLFFNIDFLFGSIAVWIVVCLYGIRCGTLTSLIAGSVTYSLWQHPYATVIFTAETLFVSWLFHRHRQHNLVLLDALFWLCIGIPLVGLFYGVVMRVDPSQLQIILIKQPINGIFNALIASLLLTYLPVHRWVNRPPAINSLSLQQTLFNLLVAFVTFPTLVLIILASNQVMDDIKSTVNADLNDASRYLKVEIQAWYQRRLGAMAELARNAAVAAPEISSLKHNISFAQKTFGDFQQIHLLDQSGNPIFNIESSSNKSPNFDDANRDHFQQLRQSSTPLLSNVLVTPTSGSANLTASSYAILGFPILKEQEFQGAVLADINLHELALLLRANINDAGLRITLIDQKGTVAVSTQADLTGRQNFDRKKKPGEIINIGQQAYHWLPILPNRPAMERWLNSVFVKEIDLHQDFPWTLIIEIAATPHVRHIQQVHTQNMLILLLVIGLAQFFAALVSRKLVQPLSQLTQVTTNLPDKLMDQTQISWVQSQITEFASLVHNFRSMAASLQQRFLEIQQANETLELRVQERTQALQATNLELETEIVERLQAELALRESEARFRQMAERERLLGEISRQMRQSLELSQILNTTVAEVRQFLQVDRVIIYQFQPDWSGIIVVESIGAGQPSILGQQITDSYFAETQGEDYKQGRIQVTEDIYSANLADCHLELLIQLNVRANLVVPILQGQALWGLLVAQHCSAPRPWLPSEIDCLKQLSIQAAIAIQQSELYQHEQRLNTILESQVEERTAELQRALRYEAMLKRITDKVRDSLDENQILQSAVEELAEGLGVFGCDTLLFDLSQATVSISHTYRAGAIAPHPETILASNFSDIYPQLLAGEYLQFCELVPKFMGIDWQSRVVLACPIIDDQGMIGSLRLFRAHSQVFSEPEVRLVLQVTTQCAIALRQARLFQAAQIQVQALEELNQLKDDFLSTVSHELRTPISNMKMAIHMLKLTQDRERQQRYLEILQSECSREADLINDLLDLQRLAAGTKILELEEISLQDWLTDLIKPFQERAQNRQQILNIQVTSDLSPFTSDRACLTRIMAELLNNACKYTPPGETINVVLQQVDRGSPHSLPPSLRIQVTNTGVELSAEECQQIFDKFYRIPGIDRWQQGGTGLGLTLIQNLAQHLGGTIRVESHSNQVCFTVDL